MDSLCQTTLWLSSFWVSVGAVFWPSLSLFRVPSILARPLIWLLAESTLVTRTEGLGDSSQRPGGSSGGVERHAELQCLRPNGL